MMGIGGIGTIGMLSKARVVFELGIFLRFAALECLILFPRSPKRNRPFLHIIYNPLCDDREPTERRNTDSEEILTEAHDSIDTS